MGLYKSPASKTCALPDELFLCPPALFSPHFYQPSESPPPPPFCRPYIWDLVILTIKKVSSSKKWVEEKEPGCREALRHIRAGCWGQDNDPKSGVTRESLLSTFLSSPASRGRSDCMSPVPSPEAPRHTDLGGEDRLATCRTLGGVIPAR